MAGKRKPENRQEPVVEWVRIQPGLPEDSEVQEIATILMADEEFCRWAHPGNGRCVLSHEAVCYIVVAGLAKIWGKAREKGKWTDRQKRDVTLRHCRVTFLSRIAAVPGLGEAMEEVEWAIECDAEGDENVTEVILPNFAKFNTPKNPQKALSGAERMRRLRARKKGLSDEDVTGGDGLGDENRDGNVTRCDGSDAQKRSRREVHVTKEGGSHSTSVGKSGSKLAGQINAITGRLGLPTSRQAVELHELEKQYGTELILSVIETAKERIQAANAPWLYTMQILKSDLPDAANRPPEPIPPGHVEYEG